MLIVFSVWFQRHTISFVFKEIFLPSFLALWLQPVFQRGWYSLVLSITHLIHPPQSQLLSPLDASRPTHLNVSFSESAWDAKRQTPLPVNHHAVCLAGNNGTLPAKPLFQIMPLLMAKESEHKPKLRCAASIQCCKDASVSTCRLSRNGNLIY